MRSLHKVCTHGNIGRHAVQSRNGSRQKMHMYHTATGQALQSLLEVHQFGLRALSAVGSLCWELPLLLLALSRMPCVRLSDQTSSIIFPGLGLPARQAVMLKACKACQTAHVQSCFNGSKAAWRWCVMRVPFEAVLKEACLDHTWLHQPFEICVLMSHQRPQH